MQMVCYRVNGQMSMLNGSDNKNKGFHQININCLVIVYLTDISMLGFLLSINCLKAWPYRGVDVCCEGQNFKWYYFWGTSLSNLWSLVFCNRYFYYKKYCCFCRRFHVRNKVLSHFLNQKMTLPVLFFLRNCFLIIYLSLMMCLFLFIISA